MRHDPPNETLFKRDWSYRISLVMIPSKMSVESLRCTFFPKLVTDEPLHPPQPCYWTIVIISRRNASCYDSLWDSRGFTIKHCSKARILGGSISPHMRQPYFYKVIIVIQNSYESGNDGHRIMKDEQISEMDPQWGMSCHSCGSLRDTIPTSMPHANCD